VPLPPRGHTGPPRGHAGPPREHVGRPVAVRANLSRMGRVLIAGGGVAGTATALALHRAGIESAVY
jgi:NADPH-dependent 2,4-dienoyl-CoA reductase/sulfur reductase-like enzyme